MKYKVYYKNDICNPFNKGSKCLWEMVKSRHIWPEDNTEITLSISDDTLSYSISNLSDRTQYLYDNDLLGLGIFVEENPRWFSHKWRSDFALNTHETSHCIKVYRIDSLDGEIDLNDISSYQYVGCLSKQLYYVFGYSGSYQDPYVSSGEENVAIGIGRFHDCDDHQWGGIAGFRPHKMSDYEQITVYNRYEG